MMKIKKKAFLVVGLTLSLAMMSSILVSADSVTNSKESTVSASTDTFIAECGYKPLEG